MVLNKVLVVLVYIVFVTSVNAKEAKADGNLNWWKNAVFYQIYPRSFKDSNNDGIGDLKGITSKLQHLKNAGVTAAWLSPIYQSPQVDQGYDISDYKKIDEDYGTIEDFDEMIKAAHELNIKIIMDFVPNHSSNLHEWFLKSENRTEGYEDYYVWKSGSPDKPPNNWLSVFSNSSWEYSTIRGEYYLHQFTKQQPDLNLRSQKLVAELMDVLQFWLDKDVDGFRMDAVPYLFEDDQFRDEPLSKTTNDSTTHTYLEHIYTTDLPETFDMIYLWREMLNNYTRDRGGDARIMMTEAYTNITNTMKYYGGNDKDGAHFTFNFQFISYLNKTSSANDIVFLINQWLEYMPTKYTANWVLGNHDNSRVATKFGPERVDGMNVLIAFLPGIMVTYNGEEIGQENGEVTYQEGKDPNACKAPPDQFESVSRDFERTPFQWDDSVNAGFNTGNTTWLPVSKKYNETNLKAQSISGVKSHFHLYQNILKLRQEEAFTNGNLTIKALSDNVIAYTRSLQDGTTYIIVINIADAKEEVDLSKFPGIKKNIRIVSSSSHSSKYDRVLPTKLFVIEPYEAIVGIALKDVQYGSSDWWKHAVFYQIYPRSFKDDTNDGIGDLKGITSKLDHLKNAGITAAWLSPIYESPQVDQGYDISNFTNIDKDYGTYQDFDNFVQKAHSLGIKIIMDFVPNHSSDKHIWFTKSEAREEGYEDFYVWKDGKNENPPNNWLSNFKYSAWAYSEKRNQYYLHQFAIQQPDLNYRNPLVVQEMKNVLKFWLDRGVDGFRMDAVPYIFEDDQFLDEPLSNLNVSKDDYKYLNHIYTSDHPQTFDMIYQWRQFLDDYTTEHGGDDRIIMTEAYTNITNTMKYYGNSSMNGAHFTFNFQLITKINAESNASDIVNAVQEWLTNIPAQYTSNWVLGNHDNHRVATRFGPQNVDGFNILTAFLPGILVTYNGEEIGQEDGEISWEEGKDPGACNGLKEDFNKSSRDFERTPFQWDDTVNAGFNIGNKTWLPVSQKYKETNLKAQSVPGIKSHFHLYQNILKLRQEEVFTKGDLIIKALSNNVVAYTRALQDGTMYIIVINISDEEEMVDLTTFSGINKNIRIVSSSSHSSKYDRVLSTKFFVLAPYEAVVGKVLKDVQMGSSDWWKHAVFYQIYPRSFKDDNNDGIGDLKGISSKLDHLKDVGVTAAWLSPIYESPQVDQGYDISNFTNLDKDYGTYQDFDNLVQKAHSLGIKIIMDFVPNHSSDKHIWFTKSEAREEGYEDFYVWKDGKNGNPPNNWLSNFKYSAWAYSEKRNQYYLHQFAIQQPDLNYRNPLVVQEMKNVLKFWLDRGVDGFRMDAVPYIFEDDQFLDEPLSNLNVSKDDYKYLNHIYTSDHPQTFDMIYEWRQFLDDYTTEHGGDDRVIMTEAYTNITNTMKYYGNNTMIGAHFTFNFQLITKINAASNAVDIVNAIQEWLTNIPAQYTSNWVLGNHDNHRVATRFGPQNVDGFNILTALLPGILVTYNGEEIGQEDGEVSWEEGKDPGACNGLKENFNQSSRDFERTPFQWDDTVNAGFNIGNKTWLPVSEKYKETNLKIQISKNNSHYNIYKQVVELRQEQVFKTGLTNVFSLTQNVVGVIRSNDTSAFLFLFNIGNAEENVNLANRNFNPYVEVILVSETSSRTLGNLLSTTNLTLQPHESIVAVNTTKTLNENTDNGGVCFFASIFLMVLPVFLLLN
ncbi:hypothetical protein RN001_003279 [Aquatica leii]|uniref:alpha-glucosidase n=1 Tax=Aquatica leii TaxID=1421715 RepID=A0AAN7SRJ2_9COLE|nr:hypothetical protein RN001_003279 [Aquatica leii]